jgi:uncharacterized coiled-coil protein SlyX
MTENDRIETIETKLAHLERALQELGQTVMRQRSDIEEVAARYRLMQTRLEVLEDGTNDGGGFEKPPTIR